MDPETAFWLLAATAQSAAALAGLSALVLVFQIRIAGRGWDALEKERNPTHRAITARAWLGVMAHSRSAVIASLLSMGLSLGTLPWVEPGSGSLSLPLAGLALASLSLALLGGAMMALAVATPASFFLPALRHIARGMGRGRLRSLLRRTHAEDRHRADAAWGPSER